MEINSIEFYVLALFVAFALIGLIFGRIDRSPARTHIEAMTLSEEQPDADHQVTFVTNADGTVTITQQGLELKPGDTVNLIATIIDDKVKNPIRCIFGENEIRVICATGLGKAEDACIVEGDGGNLEIGFNNRYLLDALKVAPAEEINVCLNTGASPCVITPAEGEQNFLYMILPVRLKAE